MTRGTTADATSGSGSGIPVRIVAILVLLSGCAAAGARAGQTAGPPEPVPAAVSGEAPAPAARTPAAAGAGLAHRATPAPSFKNDYALLLGIQYWNPLVDFSTNLEDGMTVDTYFREGALGGYLSAGADRILSRSSTSILLRLEGKVLYADFGSLETFAPGAGSLTGPVFLFQAGIAVAD